jgi:hypothetical protein
MSCAPLKKNSYAVTAGVVPVGIAAGGTSAVGGRTMSKGGKPQEKPKGGQEAKPGQAKPQQPKPGEGGKK